MEKGQLLKYIEGNCTVSEKVTVTNWLDSSEQNMREYLSVRKLHDISIWQTPSPLQSQKTGKKVALTAWGKVYREALKIAAILVVALLIARFLIPGYILKSTTAMQTLHVPAGQRAEMTLEDGTKVWLNANTTLTFPNQFTGNSREVHLDGEGFFDVTTNKSKPFIVKTDNYDVRVLGTQFDLMAYSGSSRFETSLLEGSVEILNASGVKAVTLKPNEMVSLERGSLVRNSITNTNHFLWKEGIISFDDKPFVEMAEQLELYFDLEINVDNTDIMHFRCTGKFRTKDGIEHILQVLQLTNEFTYKINDKRNRITIN